MDKIKYILFKPIDNFGFFKLFFLILIILFSTISWFIHPENLDSSDFILIAWNPGQELLTTGTVDLNYPYPLWTVVVLLPFILWTQKAAVLLWFVCNMLMLAASFALFLLMFDWQITPAILALIISLSIFFLPVLTSLWLGQLTVFSLFFLALTLYFYLHQRWTWLGIALGLSFIKPQIMLLLTGLLLIWALWQRRWLVWVGFVAVILALVLISLPFISNPTQIIGGGISSHLGTYILRTSTLWGVTMISGMSWGVPLVLSIGMVFWLGWIWFSFLRGGSISKSRMLFLFSAAIMVNLIVIPYSWMHNLILLLLPLGYCVFLTLKLSQNARAIWLILLFTIMHPLMVFLFVAFSSPRDTQAYQIIPALLLLPIMINLEYKISHRTV